MFESGVESEVKFDVVELISGHVEMWVQLLLLQFRLIFLTFLTLMPTSRSWKFKTNNFDGENSLKTLKLCLAVSLCTDRIEEDRVDYINFCLDALGISTRHNIVTVSSIENLFNSLINSIKYSSWWPEVSRGWVAESGKSLLSFIQSQFVLIWKLVFAQLFEQSAESEKKIENETDSENERELGRVWIETEKIFC